MKPRVFLLLAVCWRLPAQDLAQVAAQVKALEERIRGLEQEIQTLKGKPPQAITVTQTPEEKSAEPPRAAVVPTPGGGTLPYYGVATTSAKIFNPDIAAIGTFRGAAGFGASHPTPALELQEAEVSIQAIVDPYARADFFLSFGETGVELEEGYLTFSALPGGLQLRGGKMRAAFGKVNTLHLHNLPWIDRPLVTQNLLNAEEGISDAGLSLTRTLPAPGQVFLEATGQVFRGDSGDLFQSHRRNHLGTVGRLRAYRDVSESTNLDLGVSYARAHNPAGLVTELWGTDATIRWRPLRRALYRSFLGRSEIVWGRANQLGGTSKPFGYYLSGEYQLARRWWLGGRFDQADRLDDASLRDRGGSLLMTFRPSEFSQIRAQLRRTRYGERATANELLFQFQYSIGAHGAHPF